MRVPNVPERMKEAPAHALRAVFAGIGQALLLSDRMRRRFRDTGEEPAGQPVTPRPTASTAPQAPRAAAPATKPAPVPGPAPTPPAKPAPAPKPTTRAPSAPARGAASGTAPGAGQPFANYDELSVASLRARMRGLNVSQLRELIGYERAHAARGDVIAMFERRIAKLEETSG